MGARLWIFWWHTAQVSNRLSRAASPARSESGPCRLSASFSPLGAAEGPPAAVAEAATAAVAAFSTATSIVLPPPPLPPPGKGGARSPPAAAPDNLLLLLLLLLVVVTGRSGDPREREGGREGRAEEASTGPGDPPPGWRGRKKGICQQRPFLAPGRLCSDRFANRRGSLRIRPTRPHLPAFLLGPRPTPGSAPAFARSPSNWDNGRELAAQ